MGFVLVHDNRKSVHDFLVYHYFEFYKVALSETYVLVIERSVAFRHGFERIVERYIISASGSSYFTMMVFVSRKRSTICLPRFFWQRSSTGPMYSEGHIIVARTYGSCISQDIPERREFSRIVYLGGPLLRRDFVYNVWRGYQQVQPEFSLEPLL